MRQVGPIGQLASGMQHISVQNPHLVQYRSQVVAPQANDQEDSIQVAQYHSQIQQHYAQQARGHMSQLYQQHLGPLGHPAQGEL